MFRRSYGDHIAPSRQHRVSFEEELAPGNVVAAKPEALHGRAATFDAEVYGPESMDDGFARATQKSRASYNTFILVS